MSNRPDRASAARLCAAGVLAGLLAGAATGAIDALWTWGSLDQFLPAFTSKLVLLGFLCACYGLAGALAGVVVAAAWALWRDTRLGDVARAAREAHERARKRDPREAMAGVALALAGVPAVAGALAAAYWLAVHGLAARKHAGLVIALAMAAALVAVGVGVAIALVLARPIEAALRRLAGTGRAARILSDIRTPGIAAGALVAVAGVAVAVAWRDTLAVLVLRPYVVALLAAALAWPAARIGHAWAARLARLTRPAQAGAYAGVMLGAVVLVLAAGGSEPARKASTRYSGLGAPIARALRGLADWDRDGYSRILGGGDCDDWDAAIHPGAVEIPDDGVDQNCAGGDATTVRDPDATAFAPVPAGVPRDLDIVLITIDTVRADHVGAYGYDRPTTPNIDAVAADGAVFVNAWAHAPSTRYSIPAILTGRYPLAVYYDYSVRGWPGLSPDATTIAELMKQAGLTTGAILNYWYFDRSRRMDQGFDHYDNSNQRLHRGVAGKGPAESMGSSSRQQTDKAIAFVREHASERLFLWVHYYDPHYVYEKHPEVPDFGDGARDRYDSEIAFTDLHIGRLIDELRRLGRYDRTAIVITGDHGEGFGEHGIDLHGYHLYAAQTRVPLIVRVPGVQPVRAELPAGHIDIAPTLANLAGLPASAVAGFAMGRSLLGALSGHSDPHADRWVFQQLSFEGNHEHRGAASKRCHVLYDVSPDTSWELYRIDVDPMETRDVIDDPGPCAGARDALAAWYDRSEIPEGAAEALLSARPAIANPLDVAFGDEVRLLAVDVPAAPVRAGEPFEVSYTFEARGALAGGWKVFAHFEPDAGRARGRVAFQGDHEPPRPFAWWRRGQFIRYTRTVSVPRTAATGTYALWVGLFRGGERRPARSARLEVAEDRVRVGAIAVVR